MGDGLCSTLNLGCLARRLEPAPLTQRWKEQLLENQRNHYTSPLGGMKSPACQLQRNPGSCCHCLHLCPWNRQEAFRPSPQHWLPEIRSLRTQGRGGQTSPRYGMLNSFLCFFNSYIFLPSIVFTTGFRCQKNSASSEKRAKSLRACSAAVCSFNILSASCKASAWVCSCLPPGDSIYLKFSPLCKCLDA